MTGGGHLLSRLFCLCVWCTWMEMRNSERLGGPGTQFERKKNTHTQRGASAHPSHRASGAMEVACMSCSVTDWLCRSKCVCALYVWLVVSVVWYVCIYVYLRVCVCTPAAPPLHLHTQEVALHLLAVQAAHTPHKVKKSDISRRVSDRSFSVVGQGPIGKSPRLPDAQRKGVAFPCGHAVSAGLREWGAKGGREGGRGAEG